MWSGAYGGAKPTECLDKKLIDEEIKNANYFFTGYFTKTTVDHYNKSTPTSISLDKSTDKIIDGYLTEMFNFLQDDKYIIDNGL